jgi:GT2 family glycosyltransferase
MRGRVRDFERSFYDGTCIDGVRLVRRALLEQIGGYDEDLVACEDWDLDLRLAAVGAKTAVLSNGLVHNEARVPLRQFLAKKAYYAQSVGRYRAKWRGHPVVRRQFSPFYRFVGVFVEKGKWRRVLRHPLLFAGVLFERVAVGVTYLLNRGR